MIAIVGHPILALDAAGPRLAGLVAAIATTATTAGGAVEVIGKVGEDPDGDAVLLALARAGVGHAATLRDPAHRTQVVRAGPPRGDTKPEAQTPSDPEDAPPAGLLDDDADDDDAGRWWIDRDSIEPSDPAERPALDVADVELALRYLPDVTVVVLVEPADGLSSLTAAEASAAGAHLVVILGSGSGRTTEIESLPGDALVLSAPDGSDPTTFATLVGRYAALIDTGTEPSRAFQAVLGGRSAERAAP
jgi:sugar/nucleoside kinase (ribokinase family)